MKNKKGFTLIELLTIIAILGILVLLAAPKFLGYTEQAKLAQIKNDVAAHEKQTAVNLMGDPSYLDEFDYDGPYVCMTNYQKYSQDSILKGKISGKDLIEYSLFGNYDALVEDGFTEDNFADWILEGVVENDILVYNEKGLIDTKEKAKEIVREGNLYHILPNKEVKSKLPGAFMTSVNGEVIYFENSKNIWDSMCAPR